MPDLKNLTLTADTLNDSRGRPTVRATATLGSARATGDVPAGASKGRDEAKTIPIDAALAAIGGPILDCVRAVPGDLMQVDTLVAVDRAMAAGAGDNFAQWGANAVLPVSRALWRLAAQMRGEPLWALFRAAWGRPVRAAPPLCMFNVFNGGLHALRAGEKLGKQRIDLQEIMVVPVAAPSAAAAIACGDAIDRALKTRLQHSYPDKVSRADEAGFSVMGLGDSRMAIAHVVAAISDAGFEPGRDVQLALDVAASSFAQDGQYRLLGRYLGTQGLIDWLVQLIDVTPGLFLSVEDGLGEDDWDGWVALTASLASRGVTTIGDDLFVTQSARLSRGIQSEAADAILIKVNQNGTIAGTIDVMREACDAGMKTIVSHRSGETLDDSIADLAVGCGAFALKAGDPQPAYDFPDAKTWVRRAKYLRLQAIEDQEGGVAPLP